ncbi:unnamed protein product [Caenorhabditis angaria]|uniref:G-protein coupled receptors family 1 profile domain-containing protein n=1 Tax=Caenorhabditis angaria TaxID=860376 RepID=A0A9P1IU07_9PELO|nr:unnamed protein product [Caenorhabditis angaria]
MEILQVLVDLAPYSIAFFICFFNIIGHFGNINLVVITIRTKHLQTKHGILLSVVCTEHSLCLLGEFIQAISGFIPFKISRKTCLAFMTPYISINCCQSMMFLMISLDILISILFPMKYAKFPTLKYCSIMSIIPTCFSFIVISFSWTNLSEEQIFLCNPPLALGENGTRVWGGGVLIINITTLIIYGYIYCRIYCNQKSLKFVYKYRLFSLFFPENSMKNSAEKRVMKSLSILVIVFCCSWVICMGSVFFVNFITENQLIIILVQSYVVLFALIAFSQTFYVCYFRSKMYRREFQNQMPCFKKQQIPRLEMFTASKTCVI